MLTEAASVEHVLVVPTALFHELGHFQGFRTDAGRYLEVLLEPQRVSYRPRHQVEEDPGFKQLIPYCIFRHEGRVFHYKRGKLQGEGRLHSKRSIGIGGHISACDAQSGVSVYREAMQREIEEEVFVETRFKERCLGLINDDETEVGRVHLGVVHLFDVESQEVSPNEADILDAGFLPVAELLTDLERFETWSQICLKALFA